MEMKLTESDFKELDEFCWKFNYLFSAVLAPWGTGIRGLMRGVEPSPKVTRSY